MEEVKVEPFSISFHCIENNQAGHFCFNPQCQKSAIVCARPNCKCILTRHDDCGVITAQRLISKVMEKRTNLSEELVSAFQTIDKIYIAMIQKLSQEREQLELVRNNYGLSPRQAHFLELIKNCDTENITGKLIYQIKSNVHHTNQIGGVTQANIKQYWQHQDKQFKDLIGKLKAVYTDKKTIKPIEFIWSSYCEREGFSIDKKTLSKIGNHFRTNVAITEPAMSLNKRNVIGLKMNKIANNITVGIAQQSFYKKQQQHNFGLRQNKMYSLTNHGVLQQTNLNRGGFGFVFGTGDTIYMMYDPYLNQLKASKNEKDGFVIFKNVQKSDGLCFMVTGLVIGDQVEIVDEIPQIDWSKSHFVAKPTTTNVSNPFGNPTRAPGLFSVQPQPATTLFGNVSRPPVMSSNIFGQEQQEQ